MFAILSLNFLAENRKKNEFDCGNDMSLKLSENHRLIKTMAVL